MAALKSHPRIDLLESRRLLSAVVSNGVLVVTGTPIADRILMYEFTDALGNVRTYHVFIDSPESERPAESHDIPADGVRSITVRAGGGNDSVDLAHAPTRPDARPITAPTFIDGGIGKDLIWGGWGRDLISGGFGDDTVYASRGADWVNGGWGRDSISGDDGNDILFGQSGNDNLSGGDGDDRIYAGPGDDRLGGDAGNDRLYGQSGNDRLGTLAKVDSVGEIWNDVLDGGEGSDRIYGGQGTDRLFGGQGRDIWVDGRTAADQDTEAERIDRTPDEPNEPFPPIR